MSPLDNRLGTGLTDPPGTQPSDPLSPSLQRLADQQTQLVAAIRSIGNAIAALTTATGATSAPWLDAARNPTLVKQGSFAAAQVGGNPPTGIATYSVPASRCAHLSTVSLWGMVDIALVGGQFGDLEMTVTGVCLQGRRFLAGAAAGSVLEFVVTNLDLRATDSVVLLCSLQAGAGQLRVSGGLVGIEYDA